MMRSRNRSRRLPMMVTVSALAMTGACLSGEEGGELEEPFIGEKIKHVGERTEYIYFTPVLEEWRDEQSFRDLYVPACVTDFLDEHALFYASLLGFSPPPAAPALRYVFAGPPSRAREGEPTIFIWDDDVVYEDWRVVREYLRATNDAPWWVRRALQFLLSAPPIMAEPFRSGGTFPPSPDFLRIPVLADGEPWHGWGGGGDFVQWLIDRYGLERVLEYHRSARAVYPHDWRDGPTEMENQDFARVFGVTLDEAVARWVEAAEAGEVDLAFFTVNPFECQEEPILCPGEANAHVEDELSCGTSPEPPFKIFRPGRSAVYVLEVERRSELVAELRALRPSRLGIRGCWSPLPDPSLTATERTPDGREEGALITVVEPGKYVLRVAQDEPRPDEEGADTSFELDVTLRLRDEAPGR